MAPITRNTCGATPPTRWRPKMTQAFATYGWCVAILGAVEGGRPWWTGFLPIRSAPDEGDVALKCPTEIAITDRRGKRTGRSGTGLAGALQGHSTRPAFSASSPATSRSFTTAIRLRRTRRISAQLPVHDGHLPVVGALSQAMMRDKIGGFMSREEAWRLPGIADLQVCDRGRYGPVSRSRAKFPLARSSCRCGRSEREARGCTGLLAYLRPHFQLDELSVSLRFGGLSCRPLPRSNHVWFGERFKQGFGRDPCQSEPGIT